MYANERTLNFPVRNLPLFDVKIFMIFRLNMKSGRRPALSKAGRPSGSVSMLMTDYLFSKTKGD